MRIYLDESKRLGEGKIIIGGFFTYHNTSYIEKFIDYKKNSFSIPKDAELKSTKKYGKLFIENISIDDDFENLNIITFGFIFNNYFYESEDGYINLLLETISNIFKDLDLKNGEKINIFHDNINAKNNKNAEKKVDSILNKKFGIKSIFKIHNSKKYLGLQLADLIVGKYKEYYLFDNIKNLEEFISKKDFKQQKT